MTHALELFKIDNKVAVVTGGGRGLGRFMAEGLAEAGEDLVITGRDTAGTLEAEALADLSLYLLAMLFGTLILAFWILPSLISALCPMSTREVLRDLQGALVIAVVTSLSVAGVNGQQTATTSEPLRRSSSRREAQTSSTPWSLGDGYSSTANVFIPKATARLAMARPVPPKPMRPMVSPSSSISFMRMSMR